MERVAKKTKAVKKKAPKKTKKVKKEKKVKERIYVFRTNGTAGTWRSAYNKEDSVGNGIRRWTIIERQDGKWEVVRLEVPGKQCPKKPRTFIHKTWSDALHHRADYNREDINEPWKWICLGSKGIPGPSGKWETVKVYK